MSSFVQLFPTGDDREPPDETAQPAWLGPPEGEVGVATSLTVVVGRSEQAAVALAHATSFSTGVTLSFVAQARDLGPRTVQTLFQEQHPYGPAAEDLPDGFLRLGVELPGGAKASNIGGRRLFVKDEPDEPVFVHRGGGSGSGGRDRLTMSHDYWVWPLPQPGTIYVSCEWPLVGIPLSTVEVDGAALVEAASRVVHLWPSPSA
ncbi:MAG TPA: hypothetical protein VJ716_04070 [Gaiellaceae bacterium]|nr:hypothetical protein [Gaiellaceae bacterium]